MRSPVKVNLTPEQYEMLEYLANHTGCDVWGQPQARICRELEKLGLVRIVKARNAPKEGWKQQPYFGCKISAAGLRAYEAAPAPAEGATA